MSQVQAGRPAGGGLGGVATVFGILAAAGTFDVTVVIVELVTAASNAAQPWPWTHDAATKKGRQDAR